MTSLSASPSAVAATVEQLLSEHGPMTERRLLAALDEALGLGASLEDAFDEAEETGAMPLVITLDDGAYAFLPALFAGRVFTHRVTDVEVAHDVLEVDGDLLALAVAVGDDERYARLRDRGAPIVLAFPGIDDAPLRERGLDTDDLPGGEYAVLPTGLMAELGVQPGDLVAVGLTEDGCTVARVTGTDFPDPSRLREGVHHWLSEGREPGGVPLLVWQLCGTTDAFTAAELPLTELLEHWDLAVEQDLIARDSFDFRRWRMEQKVQRIASTHRLDDDPAFAVAMLAEHYRSLEELVSTISEMSEDEIDTALSEDEESDAAPGPTGSDTEAGDPTGDGPDDDDKLLEVLGQLAASLPEPGVAEAFLEETAGADRSGATLGLFAESLLPVAPDEAQPAVRWFLAKAHERRGDVTAAETALRDAVGGEPFAPALRDLARYAADRGDAPAALDLLRRAGADRNEPEVALLTAMSTMAARDLGRNKPCWCGSGRKYKVCHLGKEELPLAERAAWLYQKAGAYAQDDPWRDEVIEVAYERAQHWTSPDAVLDAIQDGLVVDAVLFEGGVFDLFLEERGALLPDDERALAEQWALIDRSVFDVEAVRPGASLTLRDVRTGDVRVVRERTASRTLTVGTLLCARVVPAGDTWQIFGGVEPVALHERDALVSLLDSEPNPFELVAFLSRRFAPPVLQNTEGEPLVLHELELRPSAPAKVVALLDEAYRREDDGSESWYEMVPGRDQIRAALHRDGDTLALSTNSDTRLDRVLDTLRSVDPDLAVAHHDRRTGAELAELATAGGGPDRGGHSSELPPEVSEQVIADLMRQYEDDWLDQPVPALTGLTPREAADDPTRRDDVVRLLRSWPEPTPTTMDRDRLAAALGLDLR